MSKKEEVANEEVEGVIIRPDLEKYVTGQSSSGKRSHHTGDFVAMNMNGMTVAEAEDIAAALVDGHTKGKYAKLNVGMQRMNLGNRIRAAVAKMEKTEEGSGEKAFLTAAKPFMKAAATRFAQAEKEKAQRAKEAAAKAKAAAKAEAPKKEKAA
jgi:hypothetical protein